MTKDFDNPLKTVWRQRVQDIIKKRYPEEGRRRELTAICLAGPKLLEVEQIYDPLGITKVHCVERLTDRYIRMRKKVEERRKEGKPVPEIVNLDIRRYLQDFSSRGDIADIIFLDFDSNAHKLVQECLEIVAGSEILPPQGGMVGVCVVGVREQLSQQLSIMAGTGGDLTDDEAGNLLMMRVSRDPKIARIMKGAPLKHEFQSIESEHESEWKRGRDIFFSQLLVRTMFRGRGLHEVASNLVQDPTLGGAINGYVDHIMERFALTFDLVNVDYVSLRSRVKELVAEAAIFRDRDVRQMLLDRMVVHSEDGACGCEGLISKPDMLSYLMAKCTRPYICSDLEPLFYAWSSSSPMYMDIGFFQRVAEYESKLALSIVRDHDGQQRLSPILPSTGHMDEGDVSMVRQVVSRLREFNELFPSLMKKRRTEVVVPSGETENGHPTISTRDEIVALVESDPFINADDVFERYNIVGMNHDTVKGIMVCAFKRMGRKYLSNEERMQVQVLARAEMGMTNSEIARELGMFSSVVGAMRNALTAGKREHLRWHINEVINSIQAGRRTFGASPRNGAKSSFHIYIMFSNWAGSNLENAEEIIRLSEADAQYLSGVESELAAANPKHLRSIVSSFSCFEPYELRPFELFRIAGALRRMERTQEDADLLAKAAREAADQFKSLSTTLSGMYEGLNFENRSGNKTVLDLKHRNLLIACLGYRIILKWASGQ